MPSTSMSSASTATAAPASTHPAAPIAAHTSGPVTAHAATPTTATDLARPDGSPVRVLVVDDEAPLADLLSMALRYEGWQVRTAADGAGALRAARETRPDAVVLDVMLPDMDGLEVLAKLRRDAPDVPVRVWPSHPAADPPAWLMTVATRRLIDGRRSETAGAAAKRRVCEPARRLPRRATTPSSCSSAAATRPHARRAGGADTARVGGSPPARSPTLLRAETTMAQRISRAKRACRTRLDQPGDLAVVLRVLYLVYTAGHAGRVDLAGEAIRLARQLTLAPRSPRRAGCSH